MVRERPKVKMPLQTYFYSIITLSTGEFFYTVLYKRHLVDISQRNNLWLISARCQIPTPGHRCGNLESQNATGLVPPSGPCPGGQMQYIGFLIQNFGLCWLIVASMLVISAVVVLATESLEARMPRTVNVVRAAMVIPTATGGIVMIAVTVICFFVLGFTPQ